MSEMSRSGYMKKLGFESGKWQKRWFVLEADELQLRYYAKKGASKVKGSISLGPLSSARPVFANEKISWNALAEGKQPKEPVPDHAFAIKDASATRTYYFVANDNADRAAWLDTLCKRVSEEGVVGPEEMWYPMVEIEEPRRATMKPAGMNWPKGGKGQVEEEEESESEDELDDKPKDSKGLSNLMADLGPVLGKDVVQRYEEEMFSEFREQIPGIVEITREWGPAQQDEYLSEFGEDGIIPEGCLEELRKEMRKAHEEWKQGNPEASSIASSSGDEEEEEEEQEEGGVVVQLGGIDFLKFHNDFLQLQGLVTDLRQQYTELKTKYDDLAEEHTELELRVGHLERRPMGSSND